jgi:hypothetical protein
MSAYVDEPSSEHSFEWVDFKGDLPTISIGCLSEDALSKSPYDGSGVYALRITAREGEPQLKFEGGAFFEQFGLKSATSASGVKARHVLLGRTFLDTRAAEVNSLCGIVIGKLDGNFGIEVCVSVPTLLPMQERWSGVDGSDALAFRAVFSRLHRGDLGLVQDELPQASGALSFDALFAGASRSGVPADSSGGVRIGSFLFSSNASRSALYRGFSSNRDQTLWKDLWGSHPTIKELFSQLGLRVSESTINCVELDTTFDEHNHVVPTCAGVWMCPPGPDGAKVHVVNRRTLKVRSGKNESPPSAVDDVRVKDSALWLRFGGPEGGWTRIGSHLHVLMDLSVNVQSVIMRTEGERSLAEPPRVTAKASLAWASPIELLPGLDGIERRLGTVLDGLEAIEAGQPASTLPRITFSTSAKKLALAISSNHDCASVLAEDCNVRPTSLHKFSGGLFPEALSPWGLEKEPGLARRPEGWNEGLLKMSFPLFDRGETPSQTPVDILPSETEDGENSAPSFALAFKPSRPQESHARMDLASIGGLAFHGVCLSSGLIGVRFPKRSGMPCDLVIKTDFTLRGIAAIAPDIARGRRGPYSVLIDPGILDQPEGGLKHDYVFASTEDLSVDADRQMSAELRGLKQEQNESDARLVCLSEEPFSLKGVRVRRIDARGSQQSSVVARYTSLDRSWLTRAGENVYSYMLPPQSIGESMDKPGRLEIQDEPEGSEPDWHRPSPQGTEPVDERFNTGLWRRAVEFRLTPPAELRVRPSDVPRTFVPPEWAADELFVQKGDLGLGVALERLRAEFVYGLPVEIKPSDEDGHARRARVAEIGALVGRPLDLETREWPSDSKDLDKRWSSLLSSIRTRPERLEVWAGDPDKSAFAPAKFSKGARFKLRKTALHRNPVDDAYSMPSGEGLRFHPDGLSGGALWPIESSSLRDLLRRFPNATAGGIEGVALSPLGGDADQTARFANNRVSIVTETRGGYVQRQKVEVRGRIAVLWHRAKHVVVYERTVNPSAQFTPIDEQMTRTRRPVLRKVQEYIEVLQPERRYPDAGGTSPASNAFLSGVRFTSRTIPVDSSWAEEVPDGFVLPLWNRAAAKARPQVYPRPDIAFLMHAEGASDGSEAGQECLNPENLYFFADTSDGATDDTDRWPQRNGIDGTPLLPPSPSDSRERSVRLVPRGFERFTWRLAPPSARTVINAGRADTGVYAALESVTFARGGEKDERRCELAGKAEAFRVDWSVAGDPRGICGVWERGKTVNSDVAVFNDVSAALKEVVDAFTTTAPSSDEQKKKAKEALATLKGALLDGNESSFKSVLTGRKDALTAAFRKHPEISPGALENACSSIGADLRAKIEARQLVLRQELQAWCVRTIGEVQSSGNVTNIAKSFRTKEDLERYLSEQILTFVKPALEGATVEVGKVRRGIEAARAEVGHTGAAAETILERLRMELHSARRAVEDGKPWSVQRIDRLTGRYGEAFERAEIRIVEVLYDARRRLAVDLDSMSQGLSGTTAQALSFLEDIARRLGSARVGLGEWQERVQSKWATLTSSEVEGKIRGLEQAIRRVEEAATEEDLRKIAASLSKILSDLSKLREEPRIKGVLSRLKDGVVEALVGADSVIDSALETVKETKSRIDEQMVELKRQEGDAGEAIRADLISALQTLDEAVTPLFDLVLERSIEAIGQPSKWADNLIDEGVERIHDASMALDAGIRVASQWVDGAAHDLLRAVSSAESALNPAQLSEEVVRKLLQPKEVQSALAAAVDAVASAGNDQNALKISLSKSLAEIIATAEGEIGRLALAVTDGLDGVQDTCNALSSGILDVVGELEVLSGRLEGRIQDLIARAANGALENSRDYEQLLKDVNDFDKDVRRIGNDLAASVERAEAWGDRATAAISDIGRGNLASVPNNVLKALAAVGSGPELPSLTYARDRIGYYYGLVENAVDTTPVEAYFGRLGDSLKAMGVSLPFSKIGAGIIPADLERFDIGRVLGNFAGIDLSRLFRGVKMPKGAGDGLRLTHEFDRRTMKAWARIDIDILRPGNAPLFSAGPFTMEMQNPRLQGFLSLSASKNADEVEESGEASIVTDLSAIVGGQTMVTLREVTFKYAKGGGLNVNFDPGKIKLNPSLEFIQRTLKQIFPDEVGGLELVKNDGVPVGIRHAFQLPPLSIMAGTSGVQNIQISNHFELLAFPDFVIANRFALARPELPFIFSLFVLGGTGWLTVDVEYRPFDRNDRLLVIVDAGAGGSASIGFAFAGCTGSVFITFSLALNYRKLIGKSGGGLTVYCVVVVSGLVDVLRIASAVITVMLRLLHRSNGDIDASGVFRITIRISRFLKIRAQGQALYKMADGKAERSSSSGASYQVSEDSYRKAEKLLNATRRSA